MTVPHDIAVVGGCGGAGATLVAVALAVSMASRGADAILLDLDAERGDLAGGLGSGGPRTVADLTAVAGELTGDHLRAASISHPCGITLIPGPPAPDVAGLGALVAELVGLGDRPPLVIDAGSGPTAVARALAGRVPLVLVVPADAAGCRVSRRTLRLLGTHTDLRMVVNRAPRADQLPARTIARALGTPLAAVIPRADAEAADLMSGVPRSGRRARIAQAVSEFLMHPGTAA